MTFAEISLLSSKDYNRALERMTKIDAAIDWSKIESILNREDFDHQSSGLLENESRF